MAAKKKESETFRVKLGQRIEIDGKKYGPGDAEMPEEAARWAIGAGYATTNPFKEKAD